MDRAQKKATKSVTKSKVTTEKVNNKVNKIAKRSKMTKVAKKVVAKATSSASVVAPALKSMAFTATRPARTMNVYDDTTKAEINTYSILENEIVVSATHGSQSFLYLNRPKQLNALNLRMVRDITGYLRKWEMNPNSLGVIMSGIGDKAFCAGGDIMSLYSAGKRWNERGDEAGYKYMASFFREEYQLNWNISRMVTPFVAFMNGITMGGGVGLAMHAQHRIATEKTLFAMPETGIGFFPDVGASHVLSRLPHNIGMYLGLTGARLKSADLVHLGLATSFMFTESYSHLFNALVDDHHHHSTTDRVINSNAYDTDELPRLSLTPHIECIRRCFAQPSVEQIIEALEQESTDKEFAQKTIATLKKMAPLSLKVTHEQITRGRMMDLDEALTMEYDIARNMIENPDFYTGVKSVLIDKSTRGKRPNWFHSEISDVKDAEIYKYFEPPHGLAKLIVDDKEPQKGNGWASIKRITFDEVNSRTAGPSAYQYPMFKPLPQQLHPVEWTTTHEFGASRDAFHLMYWNYLFKHNATRFPLTHDPAPVQEKILSAHSLQLHADDHDQIAEQIESFEQLLQIDQFAQAGSPQPYSGLGLEFANLPTMLYNQRNAVLHAKKYVNITPHPQEKKKLQAVIDHHTPKDPEEKAMFGLLNDQMEQLTLKYPMAGFVLHKMREVSAPVPLFLENFDLKNPNEGRETFFAEEIMFKYPTEHVIAIKQQIKKYYLDLCDLLKVPRESAPAMMAAEFGTKNTDIIGAFGEDWKTGLDKSDPKTGTPYGDLFSTFYEAIEKLSFEDAKAHSIQLGINTDAAVLFPGDATRQKVYTMFQETAAQRFKEHDATREDAFSPAAVEKRMQRLAAGQNASEFDPNEKVEEATPPKFLGKQPKYLSPFDDDLNVKGVFSEGEIEEAEDARFVKQSRRAKIHRLFHAEIGKLAALGAKVTPVQGGVIVEEFPEAEAAFKKLRLAKSGFVKVKVATNNDQLPPSIRPATGSAYIVSILDDKGSGPTDLELAAIERQAALDRGEVFDENPVVAELSTSTNPFAPVASGGSYHGPTELLRKLTLTRQKLHLSDAQVEKLQTKHAIFIPSTAANLESNASILQRLLESRIPLPFDRNLNENKVFKFAETLQNHFDPSITRNEDRHTDLHKDRKSKQRVQEAIKILTTTAHTDPVRILDSGEILPGEVIPASIQKHMKPYEARVAVLPSPELFHTSASLTSMTHHFAHVLAGPDQGQAVAAIKSFEHLPDHPEYKTKKTEYTTAKRLYIQDMASGAHDITRPPEAQDDPNWTPLVTSPHPEFHEFVSPADETSPMMLVSKEERLARNFLNFIRVPNYAIDAVYPAFNYFLDDPARNPGKNLQLNFEGANPFSDHPDAFKINFGDISRPMLPPKLANTLNAHFATIKAHEDHKGNQKV